LEVRKPQPEKKGTRVLASSSADGELVRFEVNRSQWITYSDKMGKARIPLRQLVTIETATKRVVLDFVSNEACYNRLLFFHQDYIFSDFEGLGVKCHVLVQHRRVNYLKQDVAREHPFISYQLQYEFTTDDAGIEYGYNAVEPTP
jgi:hypothetical protein